MLLTYQAGINFRKKFFNNGVLKSNALVMLETAVFGLLGLMLAFTYNAAGSRYENHRQIIVEESNAIGTALLRADLYPENERNGFRIDFRKYLELRIEYYLVALNDEKSLQNKEKTDSASAGLWNRAARLSNQPELIYATQQMVPALNSMFDIASMRDFEYKALIPSATVVLVIILSLPCSFIVGYISDRSSKAEGAGAVLLPVQSGATLWLQKHCLDERLRPSAKTRYVLWLTFLFQLAMAALVVRYAVPW